MQDTKPVELHPLIEPNGFEDTQPSQSDEFVSTRPTPLSEFPRQIQIDHEMAVIRAHHARIADAIEVFWDHRDCLEYLQQLICNGGDGFGHARVGFKHEVLAALINLTTLHEVKPH